MRRTSLTKTLQNPEAVKSLFDFEPDFDRLGVDYLKVLSGPCAAEVEEALHELVRFSDGSVFRISSNGGALVPAMDAKSAFVPEDLQANEIPMFEGRRFIDADRYLSVRTGAGEEERYVGLWSDGKRWTVATFATTPGGGGEVRCLLFHSNVPLRGLTFFPAPDTPAGQLWTVQEGPSGEVRVVTIGWRHESVNMDGTAPNPCDTSLSGNRNSSGAGAKKTSEEAARERAANDIARALMEAAGMTPPPAPPGGYSTKEPLRFFVPGEEDDSRGTAAPD